MKACPECGTQYEDHVPTCLADGTKLEPIQGTPPAAGRAAPVAAREPAQGGGGGRGGAALLLLLVPVLLLGLLAVAGVGFILVGTGGSTPEPVPAPAPPPTPAPVPAPPPAPAEVPPVEVGFTTSPEGAQLYENDLFVCAAPCRVPHPAHAPLPRTFTAKAEGYLDQVFEMTEATGPFHIELQRKRVAAPAPPRPAPAEPVPQAPRPSIGRDRGKDGG